MRRRGDALRRRLAADLRDSAAVLAEDAGERLAAGFRYVAQMRRQADALDAGAAVEFSGWELGLPGLAIGASASSPTAR